MIVLAPDCNRASFSIKLLAVIPSCTSTVDGSVVIALLLGLLVLELLLLKLLVVVLIMTVVGLLVGVVTVTGNVVGMVKNGPSVIAYVGRVVPDL